MIPTVPFLHPDTWKGQAISLQEKLAIKDAIVTPKPQTNIKKRRLDESQRIGEGFNDRGELKSDARLEVETQLGFLKNSALQTDYELIEIDSSGPKNRVSIALKGNKSVSIKVPSTKSVVI